MRVNNFPRVQPLYNREASIRTSLRYSKPIFQLFRGDRRTFTDGFLSIDLILPRRYCLATVFESKSLRGNADHRLETNARLFRDGNPGN